MMPRAFTLGVQTHTLAITTSTPVVTMVAAKAFKVAPMIRPVTITRMLRVTTVNVNTPAAWTPTAVNTIPMPGVTMAVAPAAGPATTLRLVTTTREQAAIRDVCIRVV